MAEAHKMAGYQVVRVRPHQQVRTVVDEDDVILEIDPVVEGDNVRRWRRGTCSGCSRARLIAADAVVRVPNCF